MYRVTEAWDFVRNARFVRNAEEYSSLLPDYFRSFPSSSEGKSIFNAVHTYLMFVGIGRSGTTLIGALLDAHPQMIIAHQQCALKYLYPFPFSRGRIFCLLLRNSMNAARTGRQGGGGYSYAIPGQSQGNYDSIEVIGDKSRSAQSVVWLSSRPALLDELANRTQARIKMLHVIRNPYDTIARRSMRRRVSLAKMTREYFTLTAQLQELMSWIDSDSGLEIQRIPVHLEDIISNPKKQLAEICKRLGVSPAEDYLEACAGIVHQKPNEIRRSVKWPPTLISTIQQRLQGIPHLQRYSFEDQAGKEA
jgi:hypothetical protein